MKNQQTRIAVLVVLLLSLSIATAAPTITFLNQSPADINITNAQDNPVKISYNVTDADLNDSTVRLYYKANSTIENTMFFLNGTSYYGYFDDSYSNSERVNVTSNYTWTLLDNEIYPGTYNTGPVTIDNKVHSLVTTSNANNYYKTEYYNVSSTKQWGYFEIMTNSTATASPSRLYYCNSSYTTGSILLNTNCGLVSTKLATTTFDHSHTNLSMHNGLQFAVNTSANTIADIKVTSTSYFIFGGAKSWSIYNVNEVTRTGMTQSTSNRGIGWSTETYTIDQHLHQYDIDENQTFYYYICANDTSGNENCSDVRLDIMEVGGLPPTSVDVYSPVEATTYSGNIAINYTSALSPNDYAISFYNISLANLDGTFNKTINTNNSLNLGYVWNSSEAPDGTYEIKVRATDVLGQSSLGYSENFTIENYANDVTICRGLWETNAVYELQNNIVTTGTCFTITANNVTLDFHGYNVSGDGGFWDDGVITSNYNDTTIKNGRLDKFYHQIYAGWVNSLTLTNMTFNGSVYADIYGSTDNSTITDIIGLGGVTGLVITGDNNVLDNVNMARYSSHGLTVQGEYNTIKNSFLRYMTGVLTGDGLYVAGWYNNFTNNTIESNDNYAIRMPSNANHNIFISNNIWNCSSVVYGCISVEDSDNNTFDRNIINFSKGHGIIIDSGFTNSVNNVFKNTNMTDINLTAVNLTDAGGLNNTFLNFSYEDESVEAGSQLVREWYYRAYINDTAGTPISTATIYSVNTSVKSMFTITSNTGGGYTSNKSIREYTNNGGTIGYDSNYTMYAISATGVNISHTYNVTDKTNYLEDVFTFPVYSAVYSGGGGGVDTVLEEGNVTSQDIQAEEETVFGNVKYAVILVFFFLFLAISIKETKKTKEIDEAKLT